MENERDIRTIQNPLEAYHPALCQRYIEECMASHKSWLDGLAEKAVAAPVTWNSTKGAFSAWIFLLEGDFVLQEQSNIIRRVML